MINIDMYYIDLRQALFVVVWAGLSFLAAKFLYKKKSKFRKPKGIIFLLILFVILAILHNAVFAIGYYFYEKEIEEPFFFLLALLSFGAAVFLIPVQLFGNKKKKTTGSKKK